MLTDLIQRRALIAAFANRDIATRYRSSALGWLWSLAQPLATLIIFTAVFSVVFRVQAPPLGVNPASSSYAAFLFTGIVTWNVLQGILMVSITQLKSSGDLLKKVQFPAWALVIGSSLVQLLQIVLEFAVLILMLLWLRNIGWTWLLAIPIIIGLYLFAQGLGLMLAILNAHFGDVQYIVTVVLGALYFLTPVLYPMSLLDGQNEILSAIVMANPMSWYVQSMRDVMYSLTAPSVIEIGALLVGGFLVFWLGFTVFRRTSDDLGELL